MWIGFFLKNKIQYKQKENTLSKVKSSSLSYKTKPKHKKRTVNDSPFLVK